MKWVIAAALATTMVLGAGPASAAPAHRPVTLHGFRVDAGQVSGIADGVDVPSDRVRVRIGGRSVPTTVTPISTRATLLVLDTSGSMAGNRLHSAVSAARTYLADVPSDVSVGLVSISGSARLLVSPTNDRAAVDSALGHLRAGGPTALYAGIARAIQLAPGGEILVLTDGDDTAKSMTLKRLTAIENAGTTRVDMVRLQGTGDNAVAAIQARIAAAAHGRVYPIAAIADAVGRFRQVRVTAPLPANLPGNSDRLTLTVTGPYGSAQAGTTLHLPAATRAGTPRFGTRTWLLAGLAALALGLVILLVLAFGAPRRAQLRRRLQDAIGGTVPSRDSSRSIMDTARRFAGRITARRGLGDRLSARLQAAGVPLSADEWLLTCVAIVVTTGVLAAVVLRNPLIGLVLGCVVGFAGPRTFLAIKAGRRSNAFTADLPDALQLMAGSLSSGYSLPQAVDSVVRLGDGVVADEFGRALAQARLGTPVEDALQQVADRIGCPDLGWVVMAIRIQRRVGGNLADVLLQVGETIRERAWLRRHVRGLSAEGRLSALILGALPILMGGYMFLVRRNYIRPLYTTPMGLVMVGGALILLVSGALWMRKLVKVEL